MGRAVSYTLEPPDTQGAPVPLSDLLAKLERSGSKAVSPKGAIGKYQIMPATARQYGFDPAKLTDDAYAKKAADKIGADLVKQFGGDEDAILVAYNAGPGRAKKWVDAGRKFDDLPSETQKYLRHAHGLSNEPSAKPASSPETKGRYTLVPPTPLEKAKMADEAKPKPSKPPTTGERVAEGFTNIPKEIGKRFSQSQQAYSKDLTTPIGPDKREMVNKLIDMTNPLTMGPGRQLVDRAASIGSDVLGMVSSPLTGLLDSTIGRPVETATGGRVSRETAGDVASALIPVAGELSTARKAATLAKEAGVTNNTARAILAKPIPAKAALLPAAGDTSHVARVARLQKDGVYITPWAAKGGNAKLTGDKLTSEPHVGQAIMEAQQKSIESMNRAVYNKALRYIGDHVGPNDPVGRDGIANVGQKLGKAYEELLPSIRVHADNKALADASGLRQRAAKLGEAGERQFNAIFDQEVGRHFENGQMMDGRQFKTAESELGRLSRSMKGSPDHNQRELGHLLDDTADVLRSAAERTSPPGIRPRLKAINSGYAIFTRIQDASARRITAPHEGEFGVFTPTDLMAAVKKGDRSVRKGAFARGDALLQGFAEDAASVLPNKMPDSGTAGRLRQGRAGAVVGAAVSGVPGAIMGYGADVASQSVTNSLARHVLARHANSGATRNYLKSAQGRLTAGTYGGAAGLSGAINTVGDGSGN